MIPFLLSPYPLFVKLYGLEGRVAHIDRLYGGSAHLYLQILECSFSRCMKPRNRSCLRTMCFDASSIYRNRSTKRWRTKSRNWRRSGSRRLLLKRRRWLLPKRRRRKRQIRTKKSDSLFMCPVSSTFHQCRLQSWCWTTEGVQLRRGWPLTILLRCRTDGDVSHSSVLPNVTARIKKSLHELVGDDTLTGVSDHSQLLYYRPIEKSVFLSIDSV